MTFMLMISVYKPLTFDNNELIYIWSSGFSGSYMMIYLSIHLTMFQCIFVITVLCLCCTLSVDQKWTTDNQAWQQRRNTAMADLDPRTKNLRIAHLNVCSLRNKIPDIHLFLTLYKIHVLALTETHLGTRIKDSELKIDNYKLYRCDRKHNNSNWYRGGVALYVQDHIPVKRHVFSNLSNIEIIWADIYLPHTKPVLIGCCYISK